MKIRVIYNTLVLSKEDGDMRMRDDSHLLYQAKLVLQRAGLDAIKKRMSADGNLVSEEQQYLCARDRSWGAYDGSYAISAKFLDFNAGRPVALLLVADKDVARKIDLALKGESIWGPANSNESEKEM